METRPERKEQKTEGEALNSRRTEGAQWHPERRLKPGRRQDTEQEPWSRAALESKNSVFYSRRADRVTQTAQETSRETNW